VEVAVKILGDTTLAQQREITFNGSKCEPRSGQVNGLVGINLSHQSLSDLDLHGIDLSCVDMTQSEFHRTNFNKAILKGTDFSGATFDDWKVPGFSEAIKQGVPREGVVARAKWLHDLVKPWQRYRCWVADFRGADLSGASFEGAGLAGVDFAEAKLTGAIFKDANLSRANFRGALVDPDQFSEACADDPPLFDEGSITVRACSR
jgi:uncharacterized protein YjbI with pentapeptide repeats